MCGGLLINVMLPDGHELNEIFQTGILQNFQGRHALVYDINTANETWEWVNLKEVRDRSFSHL